LVNFFNKYILGIFRVCHGCKTQDGMDCKYCIRNGKSPRTDRKDMWRKDG